jgi:hypothetical protein
MSNPDWLSFKSRKAWCGRLAELSSWVVKVMRKVSAPVNASGLARGFEEEILIE